MVVFVEVLLGVLLEGFVVVLLVVFVVVLLGVLRESFSWSFCERKTARPRPRPRPRSRPKSKS